MNYGDARTLPLLERDAKSAGKPLLIEADDELVGHKDDRHAHLPGPLYHLLALGEVVRYIIFGIRHCVLFEKLFCHVAKVAGGSAVKRDGLHGTAIIASSRYPQKFGAVFLN